MSEKMPSSIAELQPGDVIEFANATYKAELPLFEDMVAQNIAPIYTEGEEFEWKHREKLHELLRPQGNNGTILNVRLVVLDSAYERLARSDEYGMKIMKGVNIKHILSANELRQAEYFGYAFTADIKQSGKEMKQIYRQVFLLPSDWGKNNIRPLQAHNSHVRRIYTVPVGERDPVDFSNTPRKIGFAALNNS